MTGYALERTIVGWRSDHSENTHLDRRFTIVREDDTTLHYPRGTDWPELVTWDCGVERRTVLVHEPDYRETTEDHWACLHCGQVVHPVYELRRKP